MNGESEWKERCQNFTMSGIRYFCSSTKIWFHKKRVWKRCNWSNSETHKYWHRKNISAESNLLCFSTSICFFRGHSRKVQHENFGDVTHLNIEFMWLCCNWVFIINWLEPKTKPPCQTKLVQISKLKVILGVITFSQVFVLWSFY